MRHTRLLSELHEHALPQPRLWQKTEKALEQLPSDIDWNDIQLQLPTHIHLLKTQGSFALRNEWLNKTPAFVNTLLSVRGFSAKRVRTLWKTLSFASPSDLLTHFDQGHVAKLKGFGEKRQAQLHHNLRFFLKHQHHLLLSHADNYLHRLENHLRNALGNESMCWPEREAEEEVVEELVCSVFAPHKNRKTLVKVLADLSEVKVDETRSSPFSIRGRMGDRGVRLHVRLRQSPKAAHAAAPLPRLRGILHAHSTYSDGKHSLKDMATYCKEQGYEYLGISDHSTSAFYANGLSIPEIQQQQQDIDKLNKTLAPFRIFKGIESDIRADGSLDYPDQILQSFDFVIASIHSGIDMDKETAMTRLMRAIENPFTTLLGHPTGRLLLTRPGYPVDHERIIKACAAHQVAIEINASPYRLDLDFRYIPLAIQHQVWLSVNPDAHEKKAVHDTKYGLRMAQKGGATEHHLLNSLGTKELAAHFEKRKVRQKSP